MTGTQFADSIKNLPQAKREAAILAEIDKGNIPESMRTLQPVTYTATTKSGEKKEVKMYVMPDYISIGSDKDSLRVPMTPQTAQKIADKMGCSLPTRKMVDEIYAHADRKVTFEQVATPASLTDGKVGDEKQAAIDRYHVSNDGLIKHDAAVDKAAQGVPGSGIMAGHKKDIIIGEPVAAGHVGIYGAYDKSGKPIHAFNVGSHAHGDFYVDYSHGARMVNNTVYVDGKPMPLDQVLHDQELAPLMAPPAPAGKQPIYHY